MPSYGWELLPEGIWKFTAEDGMSMWCSNSFKEQIIKHPKVIAAYEEYLKEQDANHN